MDLYFHTFTSIPDFLSGRPSVQENILNFGFISEEKEILVCSVLIAEKKSMTEANSARTAVPK